MDTNLVVIFLIGFSVLQALWTNIAVYDPRINSGNIMVAILIGLMIPLIYVIPQWGSWFVLAFWLIFGYLPYWLRSYSFKLIAKNRLDDAIKLQYLARILHPFNQYLAQPKITQARKLELAGDTQAAIDILLQFENDSQWRIYAIDRAFMLKRAYSERLAWIRENLSDKDYHRDPSLLQMYLKSLGAVGDLNTMLSEFIRLKSGAERIAKRLMENFLTIFAYCGKVEEVEMLLESSFRTNSDEEKQLWLGISHYAAGNIDEAVEILTELVNHGSKAMSINARYFLDEPPIVADTILTPESETLLKDLKFELEKNTLFLRMS